MKKNVLVTQGSLWGDCAGVQNKDCGASSLPPSDLKPQTLPSHLTPCTEANNKKESATAAKRVILEGVVVEAKSNFDASEAEVPNDFRGPSMSSPEPQNPSETLIKPTIRRAKRLKPQHMTQSEGKDQFYPTPDKIAGMMLAGVNWDKVGSILEPSAGKGDLLMAAIKAHSARKGYTQHSDKKLEADCIEIDPYLRQILTYNFSDESIEDLRDRHKELDRRKWDRNLTQAEKDEYKSLRQRIKTVDDVDMRIVHDDFLTYKGIQKYDLILMNPPFADADLHLLRALELQKSGGQVICLLNAQTILDPYSKTRRLLAQQLQKLGAKISFVENAFSFANGAERTADVDVAIVRVDIPSVRRESGVYERMKKAQDQESRKYGGEDGYKHTYADIVAHDFIEAMIAQFNLEVAAGVELINDFEDFAPYMRRSFTPGDSYFENEPILSLNISKQSATKAHENVNRYIKAVRGKYWSELLSKREITGKLTNKLREEYYNSVGKMADYDFSEFNIRNIIVEINSQIVTGIKESIMTLFDKLTADHTYYSECKNNIHYFNGWKTNKAHKIGKKSIIPVYGIFSSWPSEKDVINTYEAEKQLSDLEKVFNYLDGRTTDEVNLRIALDRAASTKQTKNIECKYFKVDFFKKGTMHIKFTDQAIIDRLNVYAAQNRGWLPPYYGKANYDEMCDEGKAVVNDFQGKAAYAKVLANKEFYLADASESSGVINAGSSMFLLGDKTSASGHMNSAS